MSTLRNAWIIVGLLIFSGCNTGSSGTASEDSWVRKWNWIATDAAGLDHTRGYGEHLGPGRSARAMAIVHIAMFDAANAVEGRYNGYAYNEAAPAGTSIKAAVAQAAHDTLSEIYTLQRGIFAAALENSLLHVSDPVERENGIEVGRRAAQAILAARENDGSEIVVDYQFSDLPGAWRRDPFNPEQEPLGPEWEYVTPFAIASSDQFRAPAPPAISSAEYAAAYDEVKRLGGDGRHTPTERTPDQTRAGIYWAYDGTPSLCAPPRMYNQIALQIAGQMGTADPVELARLLALGNMAMADTSLVVWESKYHYNFWRPVTGIQEADEGFGPTGLGDGNPDTVGDPTFEPLGAPATNASGYNFSPPFPAYPSGHAGFGGAMFETLRNFYGTDRIPFTFVSDEYNGETLDVNGDQRPLLPRSFSSLSEAEEENGQSRIYLGIHWSFDKTAGIAQGRSVADYVSDNLLSPR